MSPSLYVGLISGTSMDGIDCALISICDDKASAIEVLDFISFPIEETLKENLIALCTDSAIPHTQVGEMDQHLGLKFAQCVTSLMERNSLNPESITAIGSHGQTIWHQPKQHPDDKITPFTTQISDPNTISEHTGISVVADFRRRDLAAGGQGAPMVPAFHRDIFHHHSEDRVILNLGGFANITCLPAQTGEKALAYDTGPANVLMDTWIHLQQGKQFDENGDWAAQGNCIDELLQLFTNEPYFSLPFPKSTGRELFNQTWLEQKLVQCSCKLAPVDVQASLLEFSATTVANEIKKNLPEGRIIVCGGGVHNSALIERLKTKLNTFIIESSQVHGINPDAVEATAFAWMAHKTMHQQTIDLRDFTGSNAPIILGGVYYRPTMNNEPVGDK